MIRLLILAALLLPSIGWGQSYESAVIIADRCRLTQSTNATSFTTSAGANYRVSHRVKVAANAVRLVYSNTTNWLTANLDEIVVKASVDVGGTFTQVTFGGNNSVTIAAGGIAVSDPVPGLTVAANDLVTSSTYVHSNGTGGRWPALTPGASEFTDTGGTTKYYNDTDYTLTTPYPSGSAGNHFGFWPSAIVGSATATTKLVVCVGDSICAGQGASRTVGGMFEQAARANGYPLLNAGIPGKQAANLDGAGEWAVIDDLFQFAPVVLCNLGTNDLGAGATSAQVITRITDLAAQARASGLLYYQATILPKSTSTDSWVTTGNQTTAADNAARIAVNTWIRSSPSEIDGYVEAANLVESAQDSGIWAAPGGVAITGDGTHPNQAGYTLLAAMSLAGLPDSEPVTPVITSGVLLITQDGIADDTTVFDDGEVINGTITKTWQWQENDGGWVAVSGQTDPDDGPADWGDAVDGHSYRLQMTPSNYGGAGDPINSNEVEYEAPSSGAAHHYYQQLLEQ